jgi:ribonuclease HI
LPEAPLPELEDVLARYSAGPQTGVFTDGSCEGNPGPGGWGFVWVEEGEIVAQQRGHEPATTNNRMELGALIAAYRALPAEKAITVYSDSELCVKTVNEWAAGWERRGWRRKTGPIANLELVQALWAEVKRHPKTTLRWIRAHDGSRWNEYADALAESAVYLR